MDSFIALVYTLLIYLPGNTNGCYIRLGVAGALFVLVYGRSVSYEKYYLLKRVSIGMILSPLIAVLPVMLFEQFSTAVLVREMVRMIYCVLSINIMTRIKLNDRILYLCALVALLPNFVIQMMEYLGIGSALQFVQTYYLVDDVSMRHLSTALESGTEFRSGSIFINPNIYIIIPLLSMCIFFYKDRNNASFLNDVFIVMAALSALLTGSRTALIIMLIVMAVYYYRYAKGASRFVFSIAVLFIALRYGTHMLQNSRSFQIDMDSSLSYKFESILWYLQGTLNMPLYWIFGGLGSSMSGVMDNEFGKIFAWYGLYGIYWYISYYRMMWNNNMNIIFYSKIITIVCVLVPMTASLMLCMPVYSVVCLFAFSEIQDRTGLYLNEEYTI